MLAEAALSIFIGWRRRARVARRLESASVPKSAAVLAFCCVAVVLCQSGCDESSSLSHSSLGRPESLVGAVVKFDAASERFRVGGWSKTEENSFAWTDGPSAKLALPLGGRVGELMMTVRAYGLVHMPTLAAQQVEIFANGTKVGEWQVNGTPSDYSVSVPAESTARGDSLEIEFRIPTAISPHALGLSADGRLLGICCYSLSLAARK